MAYDFITFDVDGVLSDSLRAHAQFCKYEAEKSGIKLPNKSPKEIVDNPMEKLLLKAGFPQELIPQLIQNYKTLFPSYSIDLFEGIPEMLIHLKNQGKKLGLATSNRTQNVKGVLEPYFKLFDQVSTFDTDDSKTKGLVRTVKEATNPIFVGDTEKDYIAAQEANVPFIGVSYGWEIEKNDKRFPVAKSVEELTEMLSK